MFNSSLYNKTDKFSILKEKHGDNKYFFYLLRQEGTNCLLVY